MRHLFRIVLPAVGLVSQLAAAPRLIAIRPGPSQTPTQRVLTIEDYYRVRTIAAPSLSPDSAWVSFTVSTRIERDNSTTVETWLVPSAATSPPRRIEHEGHAVSTTRWSADGWLEYSIDGQHWKADPAHPSTAPVAIAPPTREERGGGRGRGAVPNLVTSPDGRWIAQTRDKTRPAVEPAYASDFEQRHQQRFKGAIFDWKDFQRDGQPFPAPNSRALPAAQIIVTPAAGGDPKVLVDRDFRPTGLTWNPSASELLFIADPDWRDELRYESPDLWTVKMDGTVTRLTDDGYVYSDAQFSRDGTHISYVRDPGTDMIIQEKLNHGGPSDLFIRPAAGGSAVNLTAAWDLEPGPTTWSGDGRYIYFTAAIGGESHLFRVAATAGAKVEQVTNRPRRLNALSFDKRFTKIVYTVGVHDAPADVYVANIDGSDERRLTNMHDMLIPEVSLSKAERLRWPSYDGTQIEGWLLAPYGYDAKKGPYPLIVVSHGGPHAEAGYNFDFKQQYFAANGYFVLDTNFRSSTGYGEAFKWATWGAWGDKDGEDVVSGIDYVLKRYPIDPKRVGHTGHSYGGFMTNWLITQYPDRFAAAITGAGVTNWMSDYGTADIYRTKETEFFGTPWDPAARARMIKQSPLTYAGRVKTPTLFIHGEVDQRVPYEEGEQMFFALKRRGVPAKMIRYEGQPHGISGHWNNVHRMLNELAWWEKYLKPVADR